jgi:hypothetical protein
VRCNIVDEFLRLSIPLDTSKTERPRNLVMTEPGYRQHYESPCSRFTYKIATSSTEHGSKTRWRGTATRNPVVVPRIYEQTADQNKRLMLRAGRQERSSTARLRLERTSPAPARDTGQVGAWILPIGSGKAHATPAGLEATNIVHCRPREKTTNVISVYGLTMYAYVPRSCVSCRCSRGLPKQRRDRQR